jgi:DNA repair exonuclease SbcCD nuclease subunit
MPYRFVHAADIHLDSPLRSLAFRDPQLAELIGNATRRAFAAIVELCLTEQVDALLLAGDLYDGDQTSMKTARFLAQRIRLLDAAGIRVFIIRGNHDALSRITKELTFPDSVTVFGGRADAISVDRPKGAFPVAIHGLSFARPHILESLLPRYKGPLPDAVNIGLMHTSLGGSLEHDDYAPCSLAALDNSGFEYWALGHIHQRSEVRGRSMVVMAGMPQGRDVNEGGAKSVSLVTIADDRSIDVEERFTSVAQFETIPVDLSGIEDWREMVAATAKAIEQRRTSVAAEHMVARLRFTGSTPLAWRLRHDHDLLRTEAADRAFVIGKSWIEKVEIECRAADPGANSAADPMTELRLLIDREILSSAAYQAEISGIFGELRAQLPPECRNVFGTDEASFLRIVQEMATEGSEDVLALLHAKARSEET